MDSGTPNIRTIRADAGLGVVVGWKGGAESTIDLSDHLRRYAAMAPLIGDDRLFRSVSVGDWGWSAHWTNDIEISSDALMRLALEQGAAWLRQWRASHGMTQAEAADALGVSVRMWRYYEAGSHLLPKTVRLACAGLDSQARAA